jgi:hypothetical protein
MTFGSADVDVAGMVKLNGATTDKDNGLAIGRKRAIHPCVDATITVGSESTNVRAITIQLLDADGNDVSEVTVVELFVLADATGTAIATTGGSTGIEAGTDGAILSTLVAKKHFVLSSEADGDIDLTWTDTGTESVALGLKLPNGNIIVTSAFANAA